MPPFASREVVSLATARLNRLCESEHVEWAPQYWDIWHIVDQLEDTPVLSSLRPIDYETLQGPLLAGPGRTLAVVRHIIERMASHASRAGLAQRIVDVDVEDGLAAITGLATFMFTRRRRNELGESKVPEWAAVGRIADDVARAAGINRDDVLDLLHAVSRLNACIGDPEPVVALVRSAVARRTLAPTLAATLFGHRAATMWLNYEVPDLDLVGYGRSERFQWARRALARYPWWVVVVEHLANALPVDRNVITRAIEGRASDCWPSKNPFGYCVVLVDSVEGLSVSAQECRVLS